MVVSWKTHTERDDNRLADDLDQFTVISYILGAFKVKVALALGIST